MIAIGNISEPTEFDQIELSALNNLNLLNKPDGDKNLLVRSLPFQGDVNPLVFDEAIGLDFNQIEAKVKNTNKINTEAVVASSNRLKRYNDGLKRLVPDINKQKTSQTPDEQFGTNPLKEKKFSTKDSNGREIIMAESVRDALKKSLRNRLYNKKSEGNISPILPIELDLSLYGNKFLQIGDCYTVSHLPSHFKERTFFQIVGIEDNITVEGWTTSYTSVMRVDPNTDRFMSFRKGVAPETKKNDKPKIMLDPKVDAKDATEQLETSLETDITGDTYVPKETKERIARTYEGRMNGGVLLDTNGYMAEYLNDGVEKTNNTDIEYDWFVGTNFEEVTVESGRVVYRRIVPGKPPDFEQKIELVVKIGHNLGRPPHWKDQPKQRDFDQFLPKKLKVKGSEIRGNAKHPGFKAFRVVAEKNNISQRLKFLTKKQYFDAPTPAEKEKYPEANYHAFNVPETLLDKIDNVAMMYAIRNGILRNVSTQNVFTNEEWPPKKNSQNRYNDADIILVYYDPLEMIAKHRYANRSLLTLIPGTLDRREEALAKRLAEVIDPLDNIPDKAFGPGATIPYTPLGDNFRLPRPIRTMLLKDDGIKAQREEDGETLIRDTGSEVFFLSLHNTDVNYFAGSKENKVSDVMRIPKHLLKRENGEEVGYKEVLDDITRFYGIYSRALLDAVKDFEQIKRVKGTRVISPTGTGPR